jgi:hypothetical protein
MCWAIFRNRKVAGKRLSLLWIHGHIGADERLDQVFDSGLEDMDVLVRLDAEEYQLQVL